MTCSLPSKNSYQNPGDFHGRPWRVLVVDDDEAIRKTLESYLDFQENCEVFHAKNALEGLSVLERMENVDIVFVDINMPGMDGIEFVRRLKKRDSTVVAAVITGQPSMDIIVQAMRAGASDFLMKPFRFEQFQVSMERMIKERSMLLENEFLTEERKIKKALEKMNEKLEKKIREQAVLFSISESLAKTRSTDQLYQVLVMLAARLIDADQAMLWIRKPDSNQLVLVAAHGPLEVSQPNIDIQRSNHPCARVIRDGIPILSDGTVKQGLNSIAGDGAAQDSYIMVPFSIRGEILGVLAISGSEGENALGEEALFLLHLLAERASLTIENLLLYDSLLINLHATLRALVRTLEAKDPYTRLHSERVTKWALGIAEEMGCAQEKLDTLAFAGHLHDIGKIGIRDQILMKPGRLTEEEYEIIKTHPVIGAEIVGHLGLLNEETAIIRHHHERWDGKGYPDGLKGEEIPDLSRILAVADTYDAITSRRPYRDARQADFAREEICNNAGTQFDPAVVEAFLSYFSNKD